MVETLTVRKNKNTGELYSLLIDIQVTFPDAQRFRAKGTVINFLMDENEQRPTQAIISASAILPVSEPRAQLLTDDRMIACRQQPPFKKRRSLLLPEAKEREEKMLVELTAAKERDDELRGMQQQTIDRLIVAQQKIEAILVQNYELHDYPIPRHFVILPDSYERWGLRNFVKERFRLFFFVSVATFATSTSRPVPLLTISPLPQLSRLLPYLSRAATT
ncbi:hypothetical protein KI688_000736 [Linnemannia hyalina]|uniref:Uncharacterized protein n=1 Tax=Linnemannia hyalina TaxID=64524 RepID=A0A9P8BYC8_9FUNG|nr:hypothetical protein KI688_000736 [Linnemannia hyalina]